MDSTNYQAFLDQTISIVAAALSVEFAALYLVSPGDESYYLGAASGLTRASSAC